MRAAPRYNDDRETMNQGSERGQTPRSAKAAIQRGPGWPAGAVSAPDRVRLRSVQLRD
jgi:hypothetical protein